ncbi:MAG: carboxypeptidase-like regulatory domain-containing protein [Candidatus Polarisedimenticolia bacterium]
MAYRTATPLFRGVAFALVAALGLGPLATAPLSAQEDGRGSIAGELFQADGRTTLEGARAYAINVKTGKQYISEVTNRGGNYRIDGLPAGTYDVALEINGQIYVADNLVDLSSGEGVSLSYSVQPTRPANRQLTGLPRPKGSAAVLGVFKGNATAAPSFWRTPGGITLLSILGAGAAVAIIGAVDDDDKEASPSAP